MPCGSSKAIPTRERVDRSMKDAPGARARARRSFHLRWRRAQRRAQGPMAPMQCLGDHAPSVKRAAPWAIASLVLCLLLAPLRAQTIAFSASLSGYGRIYGLPTLDGAGLAAEEAGAQLDVHDDRSSAEGAKEVARQIVASDALVVVGPILTPTSLAAGPIYAAHGMASIVTTATGAGGPQSPTTFRTMATTPQLGSFLVEYLHGALHRSRATVLARETPFGQQLIQGVKGSAQRLGVDVD